MKRKIALLTALALALAGACLSPPEAVSAPIVIKISHATQLNSTKGQSFEYLKKLTEERLKGKVEVQHFHSAQLFGQVQGISALQAGAIHLIAPSTAIYTKLFPKFAVWELPYLWNSTDELRKAANDHKIGGKIFGEMEKKGLKSFGLWLNGYRLVGSWKRPIQKLEDLQGLKIRVIPAKQFRDTFAALGGNVVSIAWKEIVPALQNKVVDAVEPTASNWESTKLYELAPHITFTNHVLGSYVLATNKKWWDGLPSDIRKELAQIIKEATDYNWKLVADADAKAIEKMKAAGTKFYDLAPAERKRWIAKARGVHKDYEKVIGKDILQAVYNINN